MRVRERTKERKMWRSGKERERVMEEGESIEEGTRGRKKGG